MKKRFYIKFIYYLFYLVIINISIAYANDTLKSTVNGIFVDFKIVKDEDNRKNALEKSYLIGLKRYLSWITVSSEETINNLTNSIESSNLVTGYSIENEKFNEERYSALISVNYDLKKIDRLLKEKNIKYYAGNGPKILVLPLMSFDDQLVLWDDPNPWFEVWVERPIDANLTDFIIPEGDVSDLITISAEETRNLNFNKIRNIALKYDVKKVMVPFLKIEKKEKKYFLTLRCFDGLTKELFNIEVTKEVNEANFSLALFEILNSFTGFYDDYWVTDNIKKIESQIVIEARFSYNNYKDWMYIKRVINGSEYVNNFKILNLSAKDSKAKIKIINTEQFIAELENNNLSINKKNNVWNIKKYF